MMEGRILEKSKFRNLETLKHGIAGRYWLFYSKEYRSSYRFEIFIKDTKIVINEFIDFIIKSEVVKEDYI